ncbi:hypothetical protein, partial [Belnapia rosea]
PGPAKGPEDHAASGGAGGNGNAPVDRPVPGKAVDVAAPSPVSGKAGSAPHLPAVGDIVDQVTPGAATEATEVAASGQAEAGSQPKGADPTGTGAADSAPVVADRTDAPEPVKAGADHAAGGPGSGSQAVVEKPLAVPVAAEEAGLAKAAPAEGGGELVMPAVADHHGPAKAADADASSLPDLFIFGDMAPQEPGPHVTDMPLMMPAAMEPMPGHDLLPAHEPLPEHLLLPDAHLMLL